MKKVNFQQATFLLSAADIQQLPKDTGTEIAIVGRSNAGKSSVLNQLTRNPQLARVSKTPGRTQLINLFVLDEHHRIADLPGYGYAAVPTATQKRWEQLIDVYLRERQSLMGLVLVMDIRHPLKELDQHILRWCAQCELPVHILLNKSDKLGPGIAKNTLQQVKKSLRDYEGTISIQLFSALKNIGIDEFKKILLQWFIPQN